MEYLVTAGEMRAYDTYTIEHIGIPASVLMERAALGVLEVLLRRLDKKADPSVLCVCGTGNNGGDALALTRLLADKKIRVTAVLCGDEAKLSPEAGRQLAILARYGIVPVREVPAGEFDAVVDAVFGTGLSRELDGIYKKAVLAMNEKSGLKIAVDVPSGICADSGRVLGTAFKADVTVALACKKRGLYLYPGALYAGEVVCADIGIGQRSFGDGVPGMVTLPADEALHRPKRKRDGNKGTFGKVLLAAGSADMAGAALLAAESAYRAGAGMVKLLIPERIREIVQTRLPEALIQVYESADGLSRAEEQAFLDNVSWADALAAGPGLSVCASAYRLLELALCRSDKRLVADADGLNLIASSPALYEAAKKRKDLVMTPHMGELARLLKMETKEVVADELSAALSGMERFGCVMAAKSARTYVCAAGRPIFLNTAGNDKMATAGSGDVLTGVLAALLGQGMDLYEACVLGVSLHARAGDMAAAACGEAGITAMDIVRNLSKVG